MTCLFKGLGYALSIIPFVLMVMALTRRDWTVTQKFMLTQDPNAVVHEDSIDFMMAPFKARMAATTSDTDLFIEKGYKWCDKSAALLSGADQDKLCSLLTATRSFGIISAALGGLALIGYLSMGCRSLKTPFITTAARVAGSLHLGQAITALLTAFLWAFMINTYQNALKANLGPDFGNFDLPLSKGWRYCLVSGIFAIFATAALFTMSKRSIQAKERVATIERKRSEFELKDMEEQARKREEENLKVETKV